jgi:photosystem II stability/assembly factor-like uncharacterized protein
MKKLILLLLIIITSNLLSQSGWEIIYSGEDFNSPYYKDVTFPSDQTGWILCQNHIKKTTNAGQSWSRHSFDHLYSNLQGFYFYNENLGWVIENKYLNLTSDGGESWIVLDTTSTGARAVNFRNILTGWVCGTNGLLRKSTNGGFNWVNIPSGTTDNLNAVSFADDDVGACGGDWGTILWTSNGGVNWNLFSDPYLGFFNKVKFINSQTGFISGTGNHIYRTTNKGLNWIPYYINNTQLSGLNFNSSNTGFAFSTTNEIYNSINYGQSWNLMQVNGLNSRINSSAISLNDNIFVAADSGIIYKSTDLGLNWYEIYRDFITKENFNSVYFLDNFTGYACGNKGILFKSTNSGINWSLVNTNTGLNLTSIKFTGGNTGYICGGNNSLTGIILKTTNSGNNWLTSYNDSAHFYSIYFLNNLTGWAAGALGLILKTTNGGENWVKLRHQFLTANRRIWFIDENTGFLSKSALYKSTNGGANWVSNLGSGVNEIQFFGSTGYVTGQSGNNMIIFKTTNTGLSWDSYIPGGTAFGTMYFFNNETGWVSGNGIIRKTTNGGINWIQQTTSNATIYVNSIYFTDVNSGWAVGSYGGIMRTVNGGIGITQISTQIPRDFNLFQNYPNPFNPVTKIRFSIPLQTGRDRSILKIYDAIGREIETLVNENLNPGTYEIQWNASKYSSGVYFYSLTTGSSTIARKMVVIK